MNTCNKIMLFLMIVFVVIISVIAYRTKESFEIELVEKPDLNSCWQNILNTFKWNIDSYDAGQKKVLLTMKKLDGFSYKDGNKIEPGWTDKCVIPKEHLPIYNRDPNDTSDWDLYNQTPNPASPGFMRYTVNGAEGPDGYVVDLNKYNSNSFKTFLNKAYELYDKEFFIEKSRVEALIREQMQIKANKEKELQGINNEISKTEAAYQYLLNPSSECQRNKSTLEQLTIEYQNYITLNEKTLANISKHDNAIANNDSQIKKMLDDYNKYTDSMIISRESLQNIQC